MSSHPLSFAPTHPALPGHFPGRPIVPGALLLDAVIRTAEAALGRPVARIAQAKFTAPAGPDDALTLELDAAPPASVKFELRRDATRIASGRLELA